jgi:hypothetical protein
MSAEKKNDRPVAVFDAGTRAITVDLSPDRENLHLEVDFSDVMGVHDAERLVIVGLVAAGNFNRATFMNTTDWDKMHERWHVHFRTDLSIDLSGVTKVMVDSASSFCSLSALWKPQSEPYIGHCILPLGKLAPTDVKFPLMIDEIRYFGQGIACWDLTQVRTTNLAELEHAWNIDSSFIDMEFLEQPILPKSALCIDNSFNRAGHRDNPWTENPFQNCRLSKVGSSFTVVPCVEVYLRITPRATIRSSFNRCRKMTKFSMECRDLEGDRQDVVYLEVLYSLRHSDTLKDIVLDQVSSLVESLIDCESLDTVDLGNMRADAWMTGSFRDVAISHITVPASTTRISTSFLDCSNLRTVTFATHVAATPPRAGTARSDLRDIDASFIRCPIDAVHNLELTLLTELSNHCFGSTKLRYIGVPASVRVMTLPWADNLLPPSVEGRRTHLDLSRVDNLKYVGDLPVAVPEVVNRGFDDIWLGFGQGWPESVRAEGGDAANILQGLLMVYAHEGTVVHCRKGNCEALEALVKQHANFDLMPPITWQNNTVSSTTPASMNVAIARRRSGDGQALAIANALDLGGVLLKNKKRQLLDAQRRLPVLSNDLILHLTKLHLDDPNYRDPMKHPTQHAPTHSELEQAALFAFEIYKGLEHGTATLADVRAMSGGVEGFAESKHGKRWLKRHRGAGGGAGN